jgi:hypothetical protein
LAKQKHLICSTFQVQVFGFEYAFNPIQVAKANVTFLATAGATPLVEAMTGVPKHLEGGLLLIGPEGGASLSINPFSFFVYCCVCQGN